MSRPLALIVLAAGLGKRTKVQTPKVLLPLCGKTLLTTVLDEAAALAPARTVVVLHHGRDRVEKALADRSDLTLVDQGKPRGTGHAVQVALEALGDFDGDVVILYGDVPLLTHDTVAALRRARADEDAAAVLLSAEMTDPTGMGRILRDEGGSLVGIREQKDCSEAEAEIDEVNAGIYCFDAAALRSVIGDLSDDNAQRELYLTDTVQMLLGQGKTVEAFAVEDAEEVLGVNTLRELAVARTIMQERILLEHLDNGVWIEDPETTFIDHGVEIGADTRILPCTVIRTGVKIGSHCEVGPFAHLRVQTRMEDGAEVGNFVEVKKSVLGAGTKAKHLTYLGDSRIGQKANIGAGTITANYDGKNKHETVVADGAFIGSGTVIVAPSTVGEGAMTGAGAIVKRNSEVPPGEVWVGVPAKPLRKENG